MDARYSGKTLDTIIVNAVNAGVMGVTTFSAPVRPKTPTLMLLDALRAGMPLDDAAHAAGLTPQMAVKVAGSPLSQALIGQGG